MELEFSYGDIEYDILSLYCTSQIVNNIIDACDKLALDVGKIDGSGLDRSSASLEMAKSNIISAVGEIDSVSEPLQATIELVNNNDYLGSLYLDYLKDNVSDFAELFDSIGNNQNVEYIYDPELLLGLFGYDLTEHLKRENGYKENHNPFRTMLWNRDGFYSLYEGEALNEGMASGEDFIKTYLDDIKHRYSGRTAAVNTTIGLLYLCAIKGVKIGYTNDNLCTRTGVTEVQLDDLLQGNDCNAYASWAVGQGQEEDFQWLPCGGFLSAGEQISYSSARPGDVFVYSNDDSTGHIGFILENIPERGIFIVAESRPNDGLVVNVRTYDELADNNPPYVTIDMGDYYGETT